MEPKGGRERSAQGGWGNINDRAQNTQARFDSQSICISCKSIRSIDSQKGSLDPRLKSNNLLVVEATIQFMRRIDFLIFG